MKLQTVIYQLNSGEPTAVGVASVKNFDGDVNYILDANGDKLPHPPHDFRLLYAPVGYIDTEYKG